MTRVKIYYIPFLNNLQINLSFYLFKKGVHISCLMVIIHHLTIRQCKPIFSSLVLISYFIRVWLCGEKMTVHATWSINLYILFWHSDAYYPYTHLAVVKAPKNFHFTVTRTFLHHMISTMCGAFVCMVGVLRARRWQEAADSDFTVISSYSTDRCSGESQKLNESSVMEIDYKMPFMKCQIKVAIQYYTSSSRWLSDRNLPTKDYAIE